MPIEIFEKVKKHKAYLMSNEGMMFYQYLFMYFQAQGNVIVEPTTQLKTLDSLFTSSKADFLKIRFSDKDPNNQKKILEAVLPTIKTDWCKTVIQNEYNNTLKELEP